MGGLDLNNIVRGEVWTYDAVHETFSAPRAPMPTPRYRFGAACLDNKVYVAGGFENSTAGDMGWSLASCDVYDVMANSWDASGRLCPHLSVPRGDLALAAVNNNIHAIGGYDWSYSAVALHEVLDVGRPAAGWAPAPPMPLPKGDLQAAVVGDAIFVPGGWNPDASFLTELAVYDTVAAAWALRAPMHAPRGDHATVALDGRLFVIGGERWSGVTPPSSCDFMWGPECSVNLIPMHGVEMYSVEDDAWTEMNPMPASRFRFAAVAAPAPALAPNFHHSPSEGAVLTFGGHEHGELAVASQWAFHYVAQPARYVHIQQP